ncbi:MAG TPA: GntR family transcriptional regulator [Longimicrobium sp.]|jgi:GntR family transcriptional regulator
MPNGRPSITGAGFDFSEQARQVLAGARGAAAERGNRAIGTEHVALSLFTGDFPVIGRLLAKLGVDPAELARSMDEAMPRWPVRTVAEELRYTRAAGSALAAAVKWTQKLRGPELDAEHLLLGVATAAAGTLAKMLRKHGLHLTELAREVERLGRDEPSAIFRFQVDDASELTIYQQLVEQAKEAVATERLRPGDRLPTVRQVAEELDLAPGTVARAYRELEQQGIVTTDRARGTRVAERPGPDGAVGAETSSLVALLRPVAVGAYHLGFTADHLRRALEEAMRGVFRESGADGAPA